MFRIFDKYVSQNTNIDMKTHFFFLPGKLIEKFYSKEPRAARL